MHRLLLASIVVVALGTAADSAHGGWRTRGVANRTRPGIVRQNGYAPMGYGWYRAPGDWRTYGVANKTSPDGVWQRGYGRMGYGWYSAYGNYVGSDYSSIGFGYRNRSPGFNFNRIGNYGFTDPRTIGDRGVLTPIVVTPPIEVVAPVAPPALAAAWITRTTSIPLLIGR